MEKNSTAKIGILAIVLYATIHLLEEGLFGFPAWAEKSWGIPGYTVQRWLIHNYFFLGTQLLFYLVYVFTDYKKEFLVLGIVLWGAFNTINHTVFSIIQLKYSPGLISGFLFIVMLYMLLKKLNEKKSLNKILILKGIAAGILLWVIPVILFLLFDIFILKVV
jgi:hypothetical protein